MDVKMLQHSRAPCPRIFQLTIVSLFVYVCLIYIWHKLEEPISLNSLSDTIRLFDKVIWNNTILEEERRNLHHEKFSDNVAHPELPTKLNTRKLDI